MLDNNVMFTILLIAGLVLGAGISHFQMKNKDANPPIN
jgi:uncharacterized protein YneF (UPF0154 family)